VSQTISPKLTYKTFTFETGLDWDAGRSGSLSAEGKKALRVTAPPVFRGEAGQWTPEDLLLAAVDACTMTTFMALAERAGTNILSYRSSAEGLAEFVNGNYRFTRITLRPTIEISLSTDENKVREILDKAHHNCLIGNSLSADIDIQATVHKTA